MSEGRLEERASYSSLVTHYSLPLMAINGIFVLAELTGPVAARIRAIQERYDPKLARLTPPHVTITGSSGVGIMSPSTPVARLREVLEPIAATTPPLTLRFGPPMRFMQSEIVSLPLDPHGPLRELHERIATSGLQFERARFPFTPHATLSFYPVLTPKAARELLGVRVTEPVVIDRLQAYHTMDPQPARKILEVELKGEE
jgi:2'-5' RNA ligase